MKPDDEYPGDDQGPYIRPGSSPWVVWALVAVLAVVGLFAWWVKR